MNKNKAETMLALVEQWKQSGKSQQTFCAQHNLKVSTFGYWVARKKRSQTQPGGFGLIDVTGTSSDDQVGITYPNGVKLTVSARDLELISRLIQLG